MPYLASLIEIYICDNNIASVKIKASHHSLGTQKAPSATQNWQQMYQKCVLTLLVSQFLFLCFQVLLTANCCKFEKCKIIGVTSYTKKNIFQCRQWLISLTIGPWNRFTPAMYKIPWIDLNSLILCPSYDIAFLPFDTCLFD